MVGLRLLPTWTLTPEPAHVGLVLGVSRCFPFWQELLACYVVNSTADGDDEGKKKCVFALEDYYECLHHRKEVRSLVTSVQFLSLLYIRPPKSRLSG